MQKEKGPPMFEILAIVSGTALWTAAPEQPQDKEDVLHVNLYWDRAIQRAGREEVVWLYLEDVADAHPELRVTLTVPDQLELLDEATKAVRRTAWGRRRICLGGRQPRSSMLQLYPTTRVSWRVRANSSFRGEMHVTVERGNAPCATETLAAVFTDPLEPTRAAYVPEPQPADSPHYVGMICCPLWKPGDHTGWHLLECSAPWRKPALGWYDESNPEVTDWEIKYAVEHGVDFFMYCWYRAYGNDGKPLQQRLSHAIHEGLFNARYGDAIKFCIMWTNGPYSGVTSQDDLMENLFSFWMDNYFKRSNYLVIDNKPVLAIYDMWRLIKDLGSPEAVRAALDEMRRACVQEGFDGLWILAESRHWWPDPLKTMAACGFDASFAYCWNNVPDGATDKQAQDVILNNHRDRITWNILPNVPTASTMWDPSPWEQMRNTPKPSAHYHMSPAGFTTLCREINALMATLPPEQLGSRMVLLDNWNEWGEGHYLAPCREYGFRYLDAVRAVFTNAKPAHTDLTPEDVGLGPYEAAYHKWLTAMQAEENTSESSEN